MKASPQQHNPNRRCAFLGCTTTLSVYNSDFMCWVHADECTRARYERVATGRVGAFQRAADVEPTQASTYHLLAGSPPDDLGIVDLRTHASTRAGAETEP